jgi:hypothetical protein
MDNEVEIMSLEEIGRRLHELEDRYSMSSPNFYIEYKSGKFGCGIDKIVWATLYESWVWLIRGESLN